MKNLKIRINNEQHSEAVQRRLFEMGCKGWFSGGKIVQYKEKEYLYVYESGHISYGDNESYFNEHEHTEVTLEQL